MPIETMSPIILGRPCFKYNSFCVDKGDTEEDKEILFDTRPPIIFEKPNFKNWKYIFPIIDGYHRCQTLKELKMESILAYIPTSL